ncbi:hypothetical protein CYMTET_16977, partial [Cymbomonas tetramitiformis]
GSAGTSPAHSPPSSVASAGTSPTYSPPSSPDRTDTSGAVLRALSDHLLSFAEDPATWKERGFRPVPQLSDGLTLVEAHVELRSRCKQSTKLFMDRAACFNCTDHNVEKGEKLYRVCDAPYSTPHLLCRSCVASYSRPDCGVCRRERLRSPEEQQMHLQMDFWQIECESCPLCTDPTDRTAAGLLDHVNTDCAAVLSERVETNTRALAAVFRRFRSDCTQKLVDSEEIDSIIREAIDAEGARRDDRIDDLLRANRRSESELRIVTEDRDRLNCRREELLRERAELGVNTKQLRSTVRGLNRRVQELTAANPAAKAEKVKRLESEKLCLRSDMEVLLQKNKALKAKSDETQRELRELRCTTKTQREAIEDLHAGKAVMYRSWQEEWSKHEQLKRKLEEPHAREGPRCKARRGSWS